MPRLYNIQQEIFNYLRAKPVDTEVLDTKAQDELSVYQSLVLNGVEALLENIYPYCYKILQADWEAIVESYVAQYPSQSPIYNQQAKDFPLFLASPEFSNLYNYPNYLSELALYEWTELEVYNAITPIRKTLKLKYHITQVIQYLQTTDDPISEIRSTDIEEEPEIILLYRNPESCKARFFKLPETTLFVIQSIEAGLSSEMIHSQFCREFQMQVPLSAIETLLKELKNIGILLE
jgi:hypothetical protein